MFIVELFDVQTGKILSIARLGDIETVHKIIDHLIKTHLPGEYRIEISEEKGNDNATN